MAPQGSPGLASSETEPLAPGPNSLDENAPTNTDPYHDTYEKVVLSQSTMTLRRESDSYEDISRELPERALFLFSKENPLRKGCIYIIKNKWFTRTVLFVILLNCISLAASSNKPAFDLTNLGTFLVSAENFFIAFFALEMALKIIGMGFMFEKGTYMRDPWNVMDFLVVVLGLASLDPKAGNYTAIRAVRVLRPLRTITRVKGMRNLVITLLESLPMLLDVLVLCFFAFFIYGIIGVQLLQGILRFRCAPHTETSLDLYSATANGDYPDFCSGQKVDESLLLASDGTDIHTFKSGGGYVCSGTEVEEGDFCRLTNYNPNYGITHFDHFPAALLTIFQCISLEGWTDVMYYVQDALNPWIWIYFVSLIWFGSFFIVNLALAVLYLRFKQSQEVSHEEAAIENAQRAANNEDAHLGQNGTGDGNMSGNDVPVVSGPSWWRSFKTSCYRLQAHKYFEIVTMGVIIVNTAVMMVERHPQPEKEAQIMDYINYVLTAYFALEMVIKLLGLGIRKYTADTMNVFDAIVVVVSLVEIGISSNGSGGSGLSVLRTFRLLRIFKLARSWKELNKIINTIFKSLASIAYLSLILLLIIFIFALLGMQLFGYRYYYCDPYPESFKLCPEDDTNTPMFKLCPSHFSCYMECVPDQVDQWIYVPDMAPGATSQYFDQALCERKTFLWDSKHSPERPIPLSDSQGNTSEVASHFVALVGESDVMRHHFDDIYISFITIFQILTGENWNTVMYDGMRSTGDFAFVYFVLLVVVGNYIILNLFLAILLDNFSSGGDENDDIHPSSQQGADAEPDNLLGQTGGTAGSVSDEQVDGDDPTNIIKAGKSNRSLRLRNMSGTTPGSMLPRNVELTNRSLFVFKPENPIRVFLNRIVSHKYFEYAIIALIILSSIALALDSESLQLKVDDGDGPSDRLSHALRVLDKIFVCLFVVEAVLKIIVMGFVLHPGAYLRNPWNILDFFIVIVGIVLWSTEDSALGDIESLRALRTFRALRPIRMASRAEGMKIVVNALFKSIPPLGNVVLVCVLFFLIFSILFVNLLKGSFYYCRVACPEPDLGAEFCGGESWLAKNAGMRLDPVYMLGGIHVKTKDMTKGWCQANMDLTTDRNAGFHLVGTSSGDDYRLDSNENPYLMTSTYHYNVTVDGQTAAFDTSLLLGSGRDGAVAALPEINGIPALYHEWVNKDVNFDNVWNSFITLFEMATLEMWLDVMYDAVDSTEVDQQPIRDNKTWVCVIVVLFLVVCSFFVLNLFVGVTIDKFNDMKAKQEGRSLLLTEEQQNWLTIQKLLAATKPLRKFRPPGEGFRKGIYSIVSTDAFDGFIMSMIMCNVLFMSMEHYAMTDMWVSATTYANYIFTTLFTLEACLKLIAMGVVGYFRDAWNTFDFTVVAVSIAAIVIETIMDDSAVSSVSLLRVFRVARIFRLIPKAKGLRTLFQTLIFSLPALFNVGSVLILFFCIFSIMGMNLFGSIRENEFLDRHANFKNFPRSMLVLMRMATGESWNGIMHDCTVSSMCTLVKHDVEFYEWEDIVTKGSYVDHEDALYYCKGCYEQIIPKLPGWPGDSVFVPPVPGEQPDSSMALDSEVYDYFFKNQCGQSMAVAVLYFFGFVLVCSFILLNLVIAVILDNFQSSSANEAMPVSRFHMSRFVEAWADLDPEANYYIPVQKLSNLISELEPPLGVKGVVHTKSEVQNIIMTVDIPNRAGCVHFLETLHALSGRVAGTQLPDEEEEHIHLKLHERLPDTSYPKYSAAHYHAALYVQAAVRGFLARHQMKNRINSLQSAKDTSG